MSISSFKKRALLVKNYLSTHEINLKHSLALEVIALANGAKNWDTLSGMVEKSASTLSVYVDGINLELLQFLKSGVFPFKVEYYYQWECDKEWIHPDDVELFLEDRKKYFELLEVSWAEQHKAAMIKEFKISEDFYDLWANNGHRCLGKNKNGTRCSKNIYSRYLEKFQTFLQFYYHPKHFCKMHKNQIPIPEKRKIALLMKSDKFFSYSHVARELEENVRTVRKWFAE